MCYLIVVLYPPILYGSTESKDNVGPGGRLTGITARWVCGCFHCTSFHQYQTLSLILQTGSAFAALPNEIMGRSGLNCLARYVSMSFSGDSSWLKMKACTWQTGNETI
jgi:hypothetical protein